MENVKRNVLMNPGPATTTDTVKWAQVVPDICPREKEFCDLVRDVREKLVRVVNGGELYTAIPLSASGTGAVEACITSVLPDGGRILIVNNGAYGKRMVDIARTFYDRERVIAYDLPFGAYPDLNELRRLLASNKGTTHLAVVHHETTTGMLNPIDDIRKLARSFDCDIIVDAMSSYAGLPIDLQKEDYDYIISSANKCIQGMAGISFVICKKEKLLRTRNNRQGSYYLNLWRQYSHLESTGQFAFTPPVQVVYALNRALDEFFEEGAERRFKRYQSLGKLLAKGLVELGFKLLLPPEQRSGLLTAVLEPDRPGFDFNRLHDRLYERGFTIYPGKIEGTRTFRLANIGAIDEQDISAF